MADSTVSQMLERHAGAVRSMMVGYLPQQHDNRLYELCADYPLRGGRALRPTLCIASARAFGAATEDALQTAAAIELLHNAMLIHDDIEDESEKRRGRPALHVTEGVPIAINVGDALSLLSLRPLIDSQTRLGAKLTLQLLEALEHAALESAEGQAIELQWRKDNTLELSESDYLHMVLKKTCWLTTIFPMLAGALIGKRGAVAWEPFIRFGFLLGAAFQVQDDLLNLQGDEARYGKELAGDIYEGKRTLMLIHLLERVSAQERTRIQTLLSLARTERDAREVCWVRDRMDHFGSVEYARRVAHGLAGAARHECSLAFGALPASSDKQFIEALPVWVIERT